MAAEAPTDDVPVSEKVGDTPSEGAPPAQDVNGSQKPPEDVKPSPPTEEVKLSSAPAEEKKLPTEEKLPSAATPFKSPVEGKKISSGEPISPSSPLAPPKKDDHGKRHDDDPVEIRPRSHSRTWDPKEGVELALGSGHLQDLEPITVGQLFKHTVGLNPAGIALRYKEEGDWKEINYLNYYDLVITAAKAFIKLGVEEYHGVCILGFNSIEWMIANLGAMFANALPAGVYATNGPEACHHVLQSCKANVVVLEDWKQLNKVLQIRDQLPHLKAIVQYRGKPVQKYDNVYTWKQFMELGTEVETVQVDNIIHRQRPEQCALLIYTSGTTGQPKAVMLSHDNLTWTANCLREAYGKLDFGKEHIVSYLPLSHMAAQMTDIFLPITIGGTVHFAEPDALKGHGSLIKTLREAQPTIFFGVPRVYEKFMEGIQAKFAHVNPIKRKVGQWANRKGIKGNYRRQSSMALPIGWSLAEKLVFNKIKEKLGFQRCKIFVVGSAPTRQEVHEFFMSYDMPLMELYGMSESSGPQTFNVDTLGKWKTGSCGPLVPGAHLKINNPDEKGEGEICYYGRHVFMGYLNDEEQTKEAIDEEGWLHSGDIGKVDRDGFLYITGRMKDIIVTAGGENIAPVPIESRIKSEVPFLSHVMIIGDHRKFLTCLVTLLTESDPDTGEPMDMLTPVAKQHLQHLGSNCTRASEVIETKDPRVYLAIQEGIKRSNQQAVSNAQRVQKYTIVPKDFSVIGGELGPTLKMRRNKILEKHAEVIEAMYTVTYVYAVKKSIAM